MKTNYKQKTLVLALGVALYGCGGGGGGSVDSLQTDLDDGSVASTATTVSSTGTIDGFGSIFVNGVEFETDDAEVSLDGKRSNQGGLRLGMVVTVNGTVNKDGKTGTANVVVFDDEVQGPVGSIEIGLDGDTLLLNILGVEVLAERTSTVFDGVSFDLLAVGDLIEVSGFIEPGGPLRATRLEKKSNFVAGSSEIELKGTVSALTATEFNLDGYVVDFSSANLSEVTGGVISEGMEVEVHGTLENDRITAARVEQESGIEDDFDSDDEVSVQGTIANFVSDVQFEVNGVAVDASGATLKPAQLVLADGVVVEVEGTWDGDTLVAEEVESRRGRVKIEASVASVDVTAGTIILQFVGGTVTVQVDSKTLFDDDTGQKDPLTLGDIANGDFLEIEAINVGGVSMATRIDRDEQDDDTLQAPVDSFNPGLDITILGIPFSTVGADFEGRRDSDLSSEEFYAQLQVGDLVKIQDDEIADGVADEVEFEEADELDGEEFDDDCEFHDDRDSDDDEEDGDRSVDCSSDDDDDDEDDDEDSDDDCDSEDEVESDEECNSDDEDEDEDDDDEDEDEDEDEDDDDE